MARAEKLHTKLQLQGVEGKTAQILNGLSLVFFPVWWPILDDLFATAQDESQDRDKLAGIIPPQVCMEVDYNGRWLDGLQSREVHDTRRWLA